MKPVIIIVIAFVLLIPSSIYADIHSDESNYQKYTNSEFDISFSYPENYTSYTNQFELDENLFSIALIEFENTDEGDSTSITMLLNKDYFKRTNNDMKKIADEFIEDSRFMCTVIHDPDCKNFKIFNSKVFKEEIFDSSIFVYTSTNWWYFEEYPNSDSVGINYLVHYGDDLLIFYVDFPIKQLEQAQHISDFFTTVRLANEPLPITNVDYIKNVITSISGNKISKDGGGCLIATATFGSELALQVQQLRELRDNSLLQTESGTAFMESFNSFYYSFSPIIADYERENPVFREMVKVAITPMITSLSILNYVDMDSEMEVLGYGISLIVFNVGMYVGVPIFAIMRLRK